MSDSLSPSEIQSLFGGLDLAGAGRIPASTANGSVSDQFTLPLELAATEQTSLLALHAVFLQRWQQSWTEAFRQRFSLGEPSLSVARLRDFIAAHQGWRSYQVTSKTGDQTVWLALDEELASAHVDFLLGAEVTQATPPRSRNWGPVETQLTARLVQAVCHALFETGGPNDASDWTITPLESSAKWIEASPVFLLSELVQLQLPVACGQGWGSLHLGIPRAFVDSRWDANNSQQAEVPTDSVTLRATLDLIQITSSELQQLEIGDVILLGGDAEPLCCVELDGKPHCTATIGSHAGHKAIHLGQPG